MVYLLFISLRLCILVLEGSTVYDQMFIVWYYRYFKSPQNIHCTFPTHKSFCCFQGALIYDGRGIT